MNASFLFSDKHFQKWILEVFAFEAPHAKKNNIDISFLCALEIEKQAKKKGKDLGEMETMYLNLAETDKSEIAKHLIMQAKSKTLDAYIEQKNLDPHFRIQF